MSGWINSLGIVLIVAGSGFFWAGTLGLLRLPDAYSRLHALTKADNLGLGLIVLGLLLQSTSLAEAVQLLVIWWLVLVSGAAASHLIARALYQREAETTERLE